MRIYTRRGDDGTTRLLFGGRVPKDAPAPSAYGEVDEAQACIGVARAEAEPGGELDGLLVAVERDLWVLMAELATEATHRHKLVAGQTLVTPEMVDALEERIDEIVVRFEAPTDFTLPGGNRVAALLDVARTVVRRAERRAVAVAVDASEAVRYLNRLSDLLWVLARWQEGESLLAKQRTSPAPPPE